LICTQLAQTVPPVLLWALTASGNIEIWMVYAISLTRGVINVFDNPARQSFVPEMVGLDRVVSAVSLNASVIQAGRLIGPALAAVIIATLGLAPCFFLNALTFVFMVAMLLLIRPSELKPSPITPRGPGQLREGIRVALHTSDIRVPLVMMGVVGLLAFNFQVVLPALARFTFHGTATTYALMMNFLAAGALCGALAVGTRTVVTRRTVSWAALAFGVALGVAGIVDDLKIALLAMIAVGGASVAFSASVQSAVQLAAEPEMRGRVLSLYQILYQGTTPLGSVLTGWLAATAGARAGLVVGSVAALLAGAWGLLFGGKPRDVSIGDIGPVELATLEAGAAEPYAP
jgi:MFS family permease